MSQKTDHSRIAFGPGGQILEVPANEKLLEQIQTTPPLPPTDLLKLAAFYQGYPTNQPLAVHLALLALTVQVSDRRLQEALTKTDKSVAKGIAAVAASSSDFWEDFFDFGRDEHGEPFKPVTLLEVRWVLFSGVGLLIETSNLKDGKRMHFVIGVSPSPASF